MEDYSEYLRRRERDARRLADAAASPQIARLHADMADHFRHLADGAAAGTPPTLRIVEG